MTISNQQELTSPQSVSQDDNVSAGSKSKEFNYKDYHKWMNEQLTQHMPTLTVALLGNPTYRRPTEWRYGSKRSLVVHIGGRWKGRFHDFETGESGDALELVKTKTGYTGKALSDWVKGFIGYLPKGAKNEPQEWTPITPVPEDVINLSFEASLIQGFTQRGLKETGRYGYRDLEGNLVGYVIRLEGPDSKITLPLTYCQNQQGQKIWKWKGLPVPRPPYGCESLKDSNNPILIVEGEKTAEAAKKLFPERTILSWVAGSGSVHLTDWSCVANREVILWPDNDTAGIKCMSRLEQLLKEAGVQSVQIVTLPTNTPDSWDLADPIPDQWENKDLNLILYNLENIHCKSEEK